MLGGRRQRKERELADAHPGVERDRDGVHVRELEGDMAVPCWVDESRRAVYEQSKPAERALALDPRHHVVGKPDPLARRAEDELVRVKDERGHRRELHELGDVVERAREIDERMPARSEDAETMIEADVDRGGLHALRVERVDPDPPGRDRRADVTIGEDHWRPSMRGRGPAASPSRAAASGGGGA